MNIDYTVTALMFPAIPLLMSVYSNRFHTLSKLIRELHDEHVYEKHIPPEWKKQFINLSGRITLLRWTILFAAFGFLFNMLTVLGLYLNELFVARLIFGSCCLSMIISILFLVNFWVIWGNFGLFWFSLDHFGSFRLILVHFGSFWFILFNFWLIFG